MALTPPPLELDFRVASSAVEGLRFHLAARITDLVEIRGQLETMVLRDSTRRARVRTLCRQNEATRRVMLTAGRSDHPEFHSLFAAGVELGSELATLDERLAGLEQRIAGLEAEIGSLRRLRDSLAASDALRGIVYDESSARYTRAARRLTQLVDLDHGQLAGAVLDGPVQELADLANRIEVVRRMIAHRGQRPDREFAHCRSAAQSALRAFDRVVFETRPMSLDVAGVATSLRELARRVAEPAACRFELIGEVTPLPPSLEITLFRIAQEALRNALQHGKALHADLVLSFQRDRVTLLVRDDGEGFDVVATEARLTRTGGLGLIMMRERTNIEAGAIKLRSSPGGGTEVRVSFPVPPPDG